MKWLKLNLEFQRYRLTENKPFCKLDTGKKYQALVLTNQERFLQIFDNV